MALLGWNAKRFAIASRASVTGWPGGVWNFHSSSTQQPSRPAGPLPLTQVSGDLGLSVNQCRNQWVEFGVCLKELVSLFSSGERLLSLVAVAIFKTNLIDNSEDTMGSHKVYYVLMNYWKQICFHRKQPTKICKVLGLLAICIYRLSRQNYFSPNST